MTLNRAVVPPMTPVRTGRGASLGLFHSLFHDCEAA